MGHAATYAEVARLRAALLALAEKLDELVCCTADERTQYALADLADEAERAAKD